MGEDGGGDGAVGFHGLLWVRLKPRGVGSIVVGDRGRRGAEVERAAPDEAEKNLAGVKPVRAEHGARLERGEGGELRADPRGEFGVGAGRGGGLERAGRQGRG